MLEKMAGKSGMRAGIEKALNKMERSIMNEVESSAIRAPSFESLKLLLVTGNSLEFLPPEGGMKVFRLDRYVCKRDPMGNLLETITRESISPMELPEDIREAARRGKQENSGKPDVEDSFELYTCVRRTQTGWEVWQEVEDVRVDNSYGTYPKDKSPWRCQRLVTMDGEDYGRGFVEEYLGDLKSLEGLMMSIVEGSAAAAKVIFLRNPNATTSAAELAKAPNGAFVNGKRDDIGVLQLEKYADFRVCKETIDGLKDSLSFAFLLNSAIQRNGERVTAEEIRYMANELETTLGGVYSRLSQEWQLPLVSVIAQRMQSQGRLPQLPPNVIKPVVVTGVEAIGRGNDLTKLAGFLQDVAPLGPEVVASRVNAADFMERCATARGIDSDGLIRSDEEVAEDQAQQQQQAMMAQLGPNAITQLGGLAKQGMVNQSPTQAQ